MIFVTIIVFAGILFLGKVWGKIRPMIEIKKDDITYHAGISHSFKKGMIPLSKNDLENSDLELGDNCFSGLSNKSKLKLKYGIMGNTKSEYDEKLLYANPKLKSKVSKRNNK